jgi:2-polyprenyl-3-methyl-5-hydroxy-6-metoxy-1,4-benzoquinol methylase
VSADCPVCGKADFLPLGEAKGFPIVECRICTHRFVHPMPGQAVIDAYYARYWINHKNIRNSALKIRRLKRILRRFLRHSAGRDFLDIGCNTGFGVEAARQLGYRATGVDLSDEAIDIAHELYPQNRFVKGTAQKFAEHGEQFDAVLCREVLEHMPEVHSFMASLRKLMRVGGVLWLTTPDAGHFRVPKDFPRWKEVIPPEHVNYFDLQSLTRLLRQYDIEILKKQRLWKPSLRVLARRTA